MAALGTAMGSEDCMLLDTWFMRFYPVGKQAQTQKKKHLDFLAVGGEKGLSPRVPEAKFHDLSI